MIIASAWKQLSYNFLFFLAGLQTIPKSLLEAAASTAPSPATALLDHRAARALPTTFFLIVINLVYAFFDTFASSMRPPGRTRHRHRR